jgi:hypothetical protein
MRRCRRSVDRARGAPLAFASSNVCLEDDRRPLPTASDPNVCTTGRYGRDGNSRTGGRVGERRPGCRRRYLSSDRFRPAPTSGHLPRPVCTNRR